MAKNPHLAWHNKRTPSVKEMNALSKFEKQYRSVSAEEVDTDHYACPKLLSGKLNDAPSGRLF